MRGVIAGQSGERAKVSVAMDFLSLRAKRRPYVPVLRRWPTLDAMRWSPGWSGHRPDIQGGDRAHLRSRPRQSARPVAGTRRAVLRDLRRACGERDQGGDPTPATSQFPIRPTPRRSPRAAGLARRWAVARRGCRIIRGEPKCCKSFLGSIWPWPSPPASPAFVASPWRIPGSVLLYPAEDALDQWHLPPPPASASPNSTSR